MIAKHPLSAAWLPLAGFVAMLAVLWVLPLTSAPSSVFSPSSIGPQESTPFLSTYHWTKPQGELHIPLRRWASRVIVRQELSAGPLARPLTLQIGDDTLHMTVAAGQIRTYRYLAPTTGSWLMTRFSIAPFGPNDTEPRELGMIVRATRLEDLADAGPWPGPLLLVLALLAPLAERASAAWRMGRLRGIALLALCGAALLSYWADGARTLALAPTLALGAAWAGMGGWLLGRLRGQLHTWPGLALALSLGFSLLPLFLSLSGIGVGLPTAWPLLLTPALITLLLTLWPAAARYAAPLAALAAGCALLWAGLYGYADALLRPPSDFQAYYEAGRRIIDGQPLYDMAALQANPFATTYKYPPLMALLVAPLSLLPLPLAGAAWRLLCVGSAAAGVLALQAAHPPPRRTSLTLIGLALLIGLSPVIRSLRFGQPELLIVAVAVLGTGLLLRGLIWESAALWALVALLKIYPLLLVLPLLLRGRRRWAQALGACLIGWTLLSSTIDGWDLIFWRDLFPSLGARDGRLSNMAIYGVVARLIDPSAYRGDQAVPAAALPSLLLCTLLLLASVWLLWRRREQMETQIWPALGMMVCTVLLVIPVGWDHYHALLLLPLIVSLGALGQPRDDATLWLGAYTLLVFGVSRDFWPTSEQTPTAFALFFGSYRTLGALLLWLWFARRPSHTPPDERALCE